MRILHCTHSIDCGGLQRQLSYLAPEQAKKGHEVHVAYFRGDFFAAKLIESGVILHHIKNFGDLHPIIRLKLTLLDPTIILQLRKLIINLNPDIIHTWFREIDIPVGLIAVKKKIPWVLREPNTYRRWPNTFSNLLRKHIGKRATAVVSNSISGDKYWEMSGFLGKRYIIRNALPYNQICQNNYKIDDLNLKLNLKGDFILYAGRLSRKGKNIFNLFEAFKQIVVSEPIQAVICGDGPHKSRIEKRIRNCQVSEKILLSSSITDTFLWTLMKNAKVFVLPSYFEGCPNAVLEAMACGCPLVVSDIPEHREFLDESMVCFVDPNSPDAISQGIKRVLDNPKEAQKKAHLAQLKAKNWQSIAKMAEEYEKVYHEVLKRNSSVSI